MRAARILICCSLSSPETYNTLPLSCNDSWSNNVDFPIPGSPQGAPLLRALFRHPTPGRVLHRGCSYAGAVGGQQRQYGWVQPRVLRFLQGWLWGLFVFQEPLPQGVPLLTAPALPCHWGCWVPQF